MTSITGNMGLTIWDSLASQFDFTDLEDNFIAIDKHDHSPERGVQISTLGLANNAVTQSKLAPLSVGTAQLQAGAITDETIAERTITGDKLAEGAITPDLLEAGSITFAQLDPNVIPLGYVAMWWRPPGSAAVPGGVWEIMDGRAWSSIENAWDLTSGNIPNMIDAFAMGTGTTSGVGIGNTGGSSTASLAHSHTVEAHTHNVPMHGHVINPDGLHWHTFMGGGNLATRQNAVPVATIFLTSWPNGNSVSVNSYTAYFPPGSSTEIQDYEGFSDDFNVKMDEDGSHSHGGATQSNGNFATGDAAPTTDTQLSGETDITPPYVGLCYIMKVRSS